MRIEVVQAAHRQHQLCEVPGKRGLAGIGIVLDAVDRVLVNLGPEGVAHQCGRAVEPDKGSAARHCIDLKTLALQPLPHARQVAGTRAEAIGELFRCEPLMVLWRARLLLRGEQLVQVLLLGCSSLHRKRHATEGEVPRHRAMVELGFGQGDQMAWDNDSPVVVQNMGDPVPLCKRGPDRKQADRGNEPSASANRA